MHEILLFIGSVCLLPEMLGSDVIHFHRIAGQEP
jgi:hypothetical protein